jgi:hypothetical protein
MYCIRQILEKKWEYNETVHQLFVDFKKAYDSVRREVLYNTLIQVEMPIKNLSSTTLLIQSLSLKHVLDKPSNIQATVPFHRHAVIINCAGTDYCLYHTFNKLIQGGFCSVRQTVGRFGA